MDVEISWPAEQVAQITLNQPERLNALDESMVDGIRDSLLSLGADPRCRVIVLTGAGRGFCAGMDMNARDLRALQYVIACERAGQPASPRGVADHLAITTAATTKLLDRLTDSVRAYLRARSIQPNDFDANLNLATAYLQLNEPRQSLPYARRAVAVDPKNGPARINLGAVYAALDRHNDAVLEYQSAAELMELSPPLLLNMADSLGKAGRHQEMVNTLDRLLRIEPSAQATTSSLLLLSNATPRGAAHTLLRASNSPVGSSIASSPEPRSTTCTKPLPSATARLGRLPSPVATWMAVTVAGAFGNGAEGFTGASAGAGGEPG